LVFWVGIPYSIFLLAVELPSGLICAPFFSFSFIAQYFISNFTFQQNLLIVLATQIIGWGIQVSVGHNIYEKRAPALTQNVIVALAAPDFVALEACFLLGFRLNIKKKIEEYCKKKNFKFKK